MSETTERKLSAGGEGEANADSSKQPPQSLEANLAKTIADLQRKLEAQDGEIRALKSGKDKAVDRLEKSTGETLAKLAQYLNVDEDQLRKAQRESVLDDLIAERLVGNQSGSTIRGRVEEQDAKQGTQSGQISFAEASEELESFELSPNDPAFIELMRKRPDRNQVRDWILERKKPQKSANPSDVVQGAALTASSKKMSSEEVEKKSAQLFKMYKSRTLYKDQIAQLEKELEEYLPR